MKTIWINCKQVVEYKQQHVVTDAEYKILMKEADGGDVQQNMENILKGPYAVINRYLDHIDILDSEPEYTDVQIELDKD